MANASKHGRAGKSSKAAYGKKAGKATKKAAAMKVSVARSKAASKKTSTVRKTSMVRPKTASKAIKKEPGQAIKKAPVKKEPGQANKKTPTAEAAKDMEVMKENARLLQKDTPADWPEGAVPNVRCFAPLPEGWHHAKKVTGCSAKGDGGLLRPCYVGPGGLVKWHKKDLEKHLGIKLTDANPKEGSRPRVLRPMVIKEFPAESIIRRTAKGDASEYVLKRCDGLDGMTVGDALLKYSFEHAGKQRAYMISDLRYDVKAGRLTVDDKAVPRTKKNEQPSKQIPIKRETSESAPSKSSSKRARTDSAKNSSAPVASKQSSSAASSRQSSSSSNAGLRKIKENILKPLLNRALSGDADQISLYTLQGVGNQLNMEKLMLDVLPDVLRTPPAERGALGQSVLKQFEAELDKHL